MDHLEVESHMIPLWESHLETVCGAYKLDDRSHQDVVDGPAQVAMNSSVGGCADRPSVKGTAETGDDGRVLGRAFGGFITGIIATRTAQRP
jgi:hypothetical protein